MKEQSTGPVLMTAREVGRLLRVSPSTIARMAARGDLLAIPLGNGSRARLRFRRSDVELAIRAWAPPAGASSVSVLEQFKQARKEAEGIVPFVRRRG